MPPKPGHIYLVDDSADIRLHLGDLLRQIGYSVDTYSDPQDLFAHFRDVGPSVILMDVRMPGTSGVEAQAQWLEMGHTVPIVLISGESRAQEIIDGFKQGAFDFLLKPVRKEALVKAVDRALALDLARREREGRDALIQARLATLTEREREILDLARQGYTNKAIGELIGVQAGTVKKHRAAVLEKMFVGSTAELIALCRDLPQP